MGPENAMNADDIHLDALAEVQREVLAVIGPIVDSDGFYLVGGTAVALQLGHRRSVDLDWFVGADFDDPQRYAGSLRSRGIEFETSSVGEGTLHGEVRGVRLSLLTYLYQLLDDLVPLSDVDCSMASLDDLVCMKLSAVAQHGSKKDFVDIWAIHRHGTTLEEMFELYRRKYDTTDVAHLLASLSYFDDANSEPMPQMLCDVGWTDVKTTLRALVEDFAG